MFLTVVEQMTAQRRGDLSCLMAGIWLVQCPIASNQNRVGDLSDISCAHKYLLNEKKKTSSFQISCMLEDFGNMFNTGTPAVGLIDVLIQPKSLVSKGKDVHRLPLEKEDTQQQENKMFKLNIIGHITPSPDSCQSRLRKTFSTPKVLVSNVYFIRDFGRRW